MPFGWLANVGPFLVVFGFSPLIMSQNLSSAAVVIGALRFNKTQDAYGIDLGSQRFRPNMVT